MPVAPSITDRLKELAKDLGLDDGRIEAMLSVLTTDVAFDASVLYHQSQQLAHDVVRLAEDEEAELRVIGQIQTDVATLGAEVARVQSALTDLKADLDAGVAAILAALVGPPASPAVAAQITFTGGTVPASISIDDTTGAASLEWLDDHGDTDAAAPTGNDGNPVVVTFSIDNPGVATIDPSSGVLTPVAEGSANVLVTVTNTDGSPADFANGNPITADPAPFSIVAGPADALVVAVNP